MSAYRAGQRVRIEVEGTLAEDGRDSVLRVLWGNGCWATFAVGGQLVHWVRDADITVLSEPRPNEPTGLGAVVEASFKQYQRQQFVSARGSAEVRNRWVSVPYWGFLDWDCLVDPVVLSEGLMP